MVEVVFFVDTVGIAKDGEILAAGADGRIYFLSPQGEQHGDVEIGPSPIISLAISGDGNLVEAQINEAAAAIREFKLASG